MPGSSARSWQAAVQMQIGLAKNAGMAGAVRTNIEMWRARSASQRALQAEVYRELSESDVRAMRRSPRAFVFGSGYSLNDIADAEWRAMATDVTVGFNAFVYERWLRVDFHVVRGWGLAGGIGTLETSARDFGELVRSNPFYRDTVFVCQDDYSALFAHRLIGYRALPAAARVFKYHTHRASTLPTSRFEDGLVHATSTLCDAVNFAACLGCTEIVLTGVDLYDSRYFWVDPDKTVTTDTQTGKLVVQDTSYRGQRYDNPHSTAVTGIVDLMKQWHAQLADRGITLLVYNPKSLLAEVMPVYQRQAPAARASMSR